MSFYCAFSKDKGLISNSKRAYSNSNKSPSHTFCGLEYKLMVFILEASSLHHAIETLPKNTRKRIAKRVFTVPGLSFNPNAVNKKKTIHFLLSNCFKSEKNFILWHGVLNNSLSKHSSNRNRPLSCPELLKVLS